MTDPTEAEAPRNFDFRHAPERDGDGYEVWEWYSEIQSEWLPSTQHKKLANAMRAEGRATEREKVRALFVDLLETAEDMLPYVPEYFREKWGHDDGVARARLWLAEEARS